MDKKTKLLYGCLTFFCLVVVSLLIFVANIHRLSLQEKDLFEKTKAENKIEPYREFLNRYPKGKFTEEAKQLLEKRYGEGIKFCSNLIIMNAEKCLIACFGYSKFWSEAIESGSSFNLALSSMRETLELKGALKSLEEMRDLAEKMMKKLIEPPLRYSENYKKLVELYGVYSQIYSLAMQPTGSLLSFNNTINDLQSQLIKLKSELNAMSR